MKKIGSLLIFLNTWLFAAAQPSIHSFSPSHGPAGTIVNIGGKGFSTTPGSNVVYFGAAKASVTSASPTQLKVLAPVGATYQTITVTSESLTTYSQQPFLLTFPLASPTISTSTFASLGNYKVGKWPERVIVADLDGDGKADVITTNSIDNTISILQNNSNLEGIAFSSILELAAGSDPKEIVAGDLDGDGKLDLVVTNTNKGLTSTISVLRNTSSTGNSISFAPQTTYSTGNGTIGISISDLNTDGRPDIIVTSGNSGFFSVFKNTTVLPGSITLAPKQDFTLLTHPNHVTTADLDQDGKEDLITSNFSSNSISVFRNTSTGGTISFAGRIDLPTWTNPTHVTTADIDGDQKLDIAVSNYSSKTIFLFRNQSVTGLLSFELKQELNIDANTICFADLNGDGRPDILTGSNTTGLTSILPNTTTASTGFSFGNKIDFQAGNYETSVVANDLNGDGSPELIAANTIQNNLTILGSPCLFRANYPLVSLSADTLYVFDRKPETVHVKSSTNSFSWNDGSKESSRSFTIDGQYKVTASNACGIASATLEVISISLTIPNIFTPNNDDLNDAFYIKDLDKVTGNKKLTIFNRYGQEVYHTQDYNNDWKAEKLATGVYYYSLHLSSLDKRIKGWVEIIR